jgi:hypothetical protein
MSNNNKIKAIIIDLKKRNKEFNEVNFRKNPCTSKYIIQLSRENALLFPCAPKKRKSVKRK